MARRERKRFDGFFLPINSRDISASLPEYSGGKGDPNNFVVASSLQYH